MSTPSEPDPNSQPALSEASLARAVVETVRSPLLVLDEAMIVVHANPAFLSTFGLEEPDAVGKSFFELAGGQWDEQRLRVTLEQALREHEEVRDLDLLLELRGLGLRNLVLSARRGRSRISCSSRWTISRSIARSSAKPVITPPSWSGATGTSRISPTPLPTTCRSP